MTNQSKAAGKRTFGAVLATVMAVLVILGVFASTAFAESLTSYNVKVIDNAEELTVTTNETEPIKILRSAGISLSSDDKLDISGFEQGKGGEIKINRFNHINIELDKTVQTYGVYSATVGEALEEIGAALSEKDEVNYPLTEPVKDGMVITVETAFSVSLTADGETQKYAVVRGTVGDIVSQAGLVLGEDDYTEPSLDSPLTAGMEITLYRVEYKEETREEAIKYSTKEIKDDELTLGTRKVETEGKNGSKEVTYKVKYVNGKEDSKEALSETKLSDPVQEVVRVGTKFSGTGDVEPNGVTSKNGYTLGQVIKGYYTRYCACARCTGSGRGITASGRKVQNGMANPYYVACNWLPLGSVICVDGVNYTVVDRGGSGLSKTGRIDIYTPEGHQAALNMGCGSCTIEIIRLGW